MELNLVEGGNHQCPPPHVTEPLLLDLHAEELTLNVRVKLSNDVHATVPFECFL
jgi:hypothetical protein